MMKNLQGYLMANFAQWTRENDIPEDEQDDMTARIKSFGLLDSRPMQLYDEFDLICFRMIRLANLGWTPQHLSPLNYCPDCGVGNDGGRCDMCKDVKYGQQRLFGGV